MSTNQFWTSHVLENTEIGFRAERLHDSVPLKPTITTSFARPLEFSETLLVNIQYTTMPDYVEVV